MKRLVVCLDGTWNDSHSGTNIYHLSNLILEGAVDSIERNGVPEPCTQEIYYSQGVGTHVFDSISGGAFGAGLAATVREAYDWLVERYEDNDEIYVFGFSRGAFTARSLVGVIARCGLLRRGAPVPPEELWQGYQILGRFKNPLTGAVPSPSWREVIFWRTPRRFFPIWMFNRESWDKLEGNPPVNPPKNRVEHLLKDWSRRVQITCLGVFDTVGSLGVDAFAIPGLRSKASQFHDTNLSNLCVNAFQALAIDEHRANFVCIPWRRSIASSLPATETDLQGSIEQRWFVGAHSNIGGGYEDDILAQYPLSWMIDRCQKIGLKFKPFLKNGQVAFTPPRPVDCIPLVDSIPGIGELSATRPSLRDSFAEFGFRAWKYFIRSKPEYRAMGRPPMWDKGLVVKTVNETLDPSVRQLQEENNKAREAGPRYSKYNPPNLFAWDKNYGRRPRLAYFDRPLAILWLGLWLFACGWGAHLVAAEFGHERWWWSISVAVGALIADWGEAWLNHELSTVRGGRWAALLSVAMNLCLVIRLVAVALVTIGLLGGFVPLPQVGTARLHSPISALVLMDLLLLLLSFGKEWCATSMIEAGLGSIWRFQTCFNPRQVETQLKDWTPTRDRDCSLLQPPAEALARDVLGLIPAYAVLNLLGVHYLRLGVGDATTLWPWVSRIRDSLNILSPYLWWSILAGAAANVIEDGIRYVWIIRSPEAPSWLTVAPANILWAIKLVAFAVGLCGSCLAVLSLYFVVLCPPKLPALSFCVMTALVAFPIFLTLSIWLRGRSET